MDLANLIQTLGFPIVCVIACGVFINRIWNDNNKQMIEREERTATENKEREEKNYSMLEKFQVSIDKFADILKDYDKRMQNIETDVKEIKEIVVK